MFTKYQKHLGREEEQFFPSPKDVPFARPDRSVDTSLYSALLVYLVVALSLIPGSFGLAVPRSMTDYLHLPTFSLLNVFEFAFKNRVSETPILFPGFEPFLLLIGSK